MPSKCGFGYGRKPVTAVVECIRPEGHEGTCFCIALEQGCYLHAKETQFVDSPDDWPEDIIMSDIERHEITAIYDPPGVTSRRQAIMAQKARHRELQT